MGGIVSSMDTQGSRLLYLMSEMGLNKSQFAKFLGTTYKQVHAWTQEKPMSTESAVLVADKVDISLDWLVRGIGPAPTPAKVDPDSLGAIPEVAADPAVERSIPTGLLAFLEERAVTESQRRELLRYAYANAASDGKTDYEKVLRSLGVPEHKRSREVEPTAVEVPANLQRVPPVKRKS
jgi:hypothetical protein